MSDRRSTPAPKAYQANVFWDRQDCATLSAQVYLIGDADSFIAALQSMLSAAEAERDQLRAELEAIRGQEAVAWASPEAVGGVRWSPGALQQLSDGSPLYALPPQQPDAVSVPREELEALQRDKQLLDAIQDGCWDVRYNNSPIADTGDYDTGVEVIGHFMQAPHERILGEDFGADVRKAIAQAMTAEAYPPARPEYDKWGRPLRALLSTKNAEEV